MMKSVDKFCTRGAEYFNCRTMPHGGAVLVPVTLATLALCASLADDGCDYARLRGAAVEMLTGSNAVPFVDCGMTAYRIPGFYPAPENSWRVVYSDECQPYEFMNLLADTSWVAAEWLKFLSLVVGGTTTMFLWTSVCLTLRPNYWQAAGIGAAVACLCQMCSFVWFYTKLCHTSTTNFMDFEAGREVELSSAVPTECSLFFGSKCAITSCIMWGVTSAVILLREYPLPVPKLIALDEKESMVPAQAQSQAGNSIQQPSVTKGGVGSGSRRARSKKREATHRNSEVTASISTAGSQSQSHRSLPKQQQGKDPRRMIRPSMRPAVEGNELHNAPVRPSSIRPAELSGSTFSAMSFV